MNVGGPAKNAIIEAEGSTDSSLAGGPDIKVNVEGPAKNAIMSRMAEVCGSRTHRTPVPRRPTSFEGQESHRTLLTSKTVIIGKS